VITVGYKREFIMTPGEYRRTMLRLLKEKEPVQRVIDLFVVPDYEAAFKSCVGTFKRWAKVSFVCCLTIGLAPYVTYTTILI
jgi:hypothetical protein